MSETNALQLAGEILTEDDSKDIWKWIGRHQAFGLMTNKSAGLRVMKLIKSP